MEKSVFQILNEYDITEHLKKKDRIIYLPWSKAWMILKSLFPSAKFTINKAADGCIYHTDGKTAWVEVSITINDQTETESLAVMDFRNKSIPIDTITSADAEKSIKRCLVKCAALHGLGLSLWTGEELSSAARKKKEDDLDDVKQEILSVVAGKLEAGVSKDTIYKAIESVAGVKNPNATISSLTPTTPTSQKSATVLFSRRPMSESNAARIPSYSVIILGSVAIVSLSLLTS